MGILQQTSEIINISIYLEGSDKPLKRFVTNIRPFNLGEVITIRDDRGSFSVSDRYRIIKCEPRLIETSKGLQYSFVYIVNEI